MIQQVEMSYHIIAHDSKLALKKSFKKEDGVEELAHTFCAADMNTIRICLTRCR